MRTFLMFVTLTAAASLGTLTVPEPATAQDVDIVGTWVLNREKSDDPREVMSRGRNRPAPPRPGAGGGRRRGGGTQAPPPRPDAGDRLLQQRLMRPVMELSITRTDSTYIFASSGEKFMEHFVDGRKIEAAITTDLQIEIKAEWKNNALEIETRVSGGGRLKERYEIDEDTGELRVEFDLNNSRMKQRFKLKRVYDRREAN